MITFVWVWGGTRTNEDAFIYPMKSTLDGEPIGHTG